MDLRLFNKLGSGDTCTLFLKQSTGHELAYYLISSTVSYTTICTGLCPGKINKQYASFNIRMASIVPLVDKGYKFNIKYDGDTLTFVTKDGEMVVHPSYVESQDAAMFSNIEKAVMFNESFSVYNRTFTDKKLLEERIKNLKERQKALELYRLSSAMTSSNPFGDLPMGNMSFNSPKQSEPNETPDDIETEEQPQEYSQQYSVDDIPALERELEMMETHSGDLKQLNLNAFRGIAKVAARRSGIVEMCGDYAVYDMGNAYMFQKSKCPVQSITGKLLDVLLSYSDGKSFYEWNDDIVYVQGEVTDQTLVFIQKYLPSTEIDPSIIERGVVEEKYVLKLKNILEVAASVGKTFPSLSIDMNKAQFILSNELSETINLNFTVDEFKSLQMNKVLRGEDDGSNMTMAVIDIPDQIKSALYLFKNNLVIFVKARKIIFRSDNLFLVFGR